MTDTWVMTHAALAAEELRELLADPELTGRWPEGFTTDDVLADLHALGRVGITVEDVRVAGRLGARYTCRVELREEPLGASIGRGLSLTSAALRCLLELEADLSAEVRDVLAGFDELLS